MNCTQQTDSFITGERGRGGKGGGEAGWMDIERTKRNVQKTEREAGRKRRKKRGGKNRKQMERG